MHLRVQVSTSLGSVLVVKERVREVGDVRILVEHVRYHLDFCFCGCELFGGGGLRAGAHAEERHVGWIY